jgi:hypothetical protein
MPNKLTPEDIKNMYPGIFAEGIALDDQYGTHMTGSHAPLRWVAVRGGAPDWKIYCHYIEKSREEVASNGDKVCDEETIRRLIPCTDEAFKMYRF